MRFFIYIIFILIPFANWSQDSDCFNSLQDIKTMASGYWVEQNSDSKKFFKITFYKATATMEKLERADFKERSQNKYDLVFNEKINLSIDNYLDCFQLGQTIQKDKEQVFEMLKFIDKDTFVFKGLIYRRIILDD